MTFSLNLEHAISYNPCSVYSSHHGTNSLYIQPSQTGQSGQGGQGGQFEGGRVLESDGARDDTFVYITGASVCVSSFSDAHQQEFLRAHDDNISTLALSRTGTLLASGQIGKNADVCVWDLPSRTLIHRLDEHEQGITSVAFTDDNLLLATAGMDMRLLVWDMTSGYIVSSSPIKGTVGPTVVAWGQHVQDSRQQRNYQLATSTEGLLQFWTLNPFEGRLSCERVSGGQNRVYNCLTFSKAGDLLFAGTTSGDVSVVSVRGLNVIQNVQVCSFGVKAIYISNNDKMIIAAGGDGTLSILKEDYRGQWTTVTKSNVTTFPIASISVSKDESLVLVGAENGDIIRVPINNINKPILHCQNHFAPVVDVQYPGGDSDRFVTCSFDNTIRLWDAGNYAVLSKAAFKKSDANPNCLSFVGSLLYSGWTDGSIRSLDIFKGGSVVSHLPNAHKSPITTIVGAHSGKFFATGCAEGLIRVWNSRTQMLSHQFKDHQGPVTSLRLFKDESRLLSSGKDKRILCWDLNSQRCVSTHMVQMGAINDMVLFNNQTNFITVGANKVISLWDIRQVKPIRIQEYSQTFEPTCIALSNHNLTYAVGGTDECIHLYDASTGAELSIGEGHSKPLNKLIFSPDDKQIVSVGGDGSIFVWNQFEL